MKNRKNILISQELFYRKEYHEYYDIIDIKWYEFFNKLNYNFIIVPNDKKFIKNLKNLKINGIVLTGGGDLVNTSINKKIYIRNIIEKYLIKFATNNNIPLIGVCRGMQLINKMFGGSINKINGHVNSRHKIIGKFKNIKINNTTNSYHKLGISEKDLSKNIISIAKDKDGYVEFFQHKIFRIYGIMWHPERQNSKLDLKLFKHIFA